MNNIIKNYTDFYLNSNLSHVYPNEFLIRIFMGKYPHLNIKKNFDNKKILDIGFGDGRNLILFDKLGFDTYGIEISDEICKHIHSQLVMLGHNTTLKKGFNNCIPFEDGYFDFAVSWNSCYYMGEGHSFFDFNTYVKEFYRTLKKDGIFILSIPMSSNFIFKDCVPIKKGYVAIQKDPYKIRDGSILKSFSTIDEFIYELENYFTDFRCASIYDDCFGQENHWYVLVCKKR